MPANALAVVMKKLVYSPTSLTVAGSSFSLLMQNQELDTDTATCHSNEHTDWCNHNIQIRTGSTAGSIIGQSDTVLIGKSAVLTVHNLPPGHYIFMCSIFQHWYESGMKGTLTVQ